MFESRKWQKIALALNLSGTILLFLSFQATSSNIKFITTTNNRTAICIDGRAVLITDPGGGIGLGMSTCPEWENARPAAVVNVEKPALVMIGFFLMVAGFLIQYLSVPDPQTIEALRAELKQVRTKRRLKK